MTITVSRIFTAPSAGTPTVTVDTGSFDTAPLHTIFSVDVSGCSFDSDEDHDGLYDVDYTGKVHNPAAHRLLFFWDLGDAIENWDAPVNMPAEYMKRSKAFGKEIQHVYTTPQTATWKLEIWEPSSGKKAFATGTILVKDPLEEADHIVLVNPNGDSDFTEITRGDYSGATFHEENATTADNIFGTGTEFSDHQNRDNVCFLFKTGAAFRCTVNHTGTCDNLYFGKYGTTSSADPIIDMTTSASFNVAGRTGSTAHEVRYQNLDGLGNWSDNDTVAVPNTPTHGAFKAAVGWRATVADCRVRRLRGEAFQVSGNGTATSPISMTMANTTFEGVAGQQYPVIMGRFPASDGSTFCSVGCAHIDLTDTLTANDSHKSPIRVNGVRRMHVRSADIYLQKEADGQYGIKANIAGYTGADVSIQQFVYEGPLYPVQLYEGGDTPLRPMRTVVENFICLSNPEGTRITQGATAGTTTRAGLQIAGRWSTNVSQGSSTFRARHPSQLASSAGGDYPAGEEAPFEQYAITGLNLRTEVQNGGSHTWGFDEPGLRADGTISLGGLTHPGRQANTFVHAPNQSSPETTYSPLADGETSLSDAVKRLDGSGMTFRFPGWNPSGTVLTTYSYNGNYVPSMKPLTGSSAIGASGDDRTLYWPLDYLGRICGPNRAVGAAERLGYSFNLTARTS